MQYFERVGALDDRASASEATFVASSILDVCWAELANYVGAAPVVLADYDQTAALATHTVTPQVRASVERGLSEGSIQAFGMASDNPFVRQLSGIKDITAHVFTPYRDGMRLVTKRNVAFYERIVQELAIDPVRIVMIGHHRVRDIGRANQAGLTTVEVPPLGRKRDGILQHRGARFTRPLLDWLQADQDLAA